MRTAMIASVLLVGCGFKAGSKNPDARMPIDGARPGSDADPPPDMMPDAQACFGSGAYTVCLTGSQLPTQPTTLPAMINTDDTSATSPCLSSAPMTWAGQPDACFVVGTTITSPAGGGKTTVTGSRPLVLLATDSMTLNTIDASSHLNATGPAADFSGCGTFGIPAPGTNGTGGGGGAGGSFMKVGGTGAGGDNGNPLAVGGGSEPPAGSAPTALRGGCAGEMGGTGGQPSGTSGDGGGVLYLVAAHGIMVSGHITANGAGATHGGHASGGSGGGSGGMIVVYAESITGTMAGAQLSANGGGGASGGDNNSNGMDGHDSTSATTAATGGNGPGGDGGAGSVGNSFGGTASPGDSGQGGGGGGGGAGYIQIHGTITSLTISPPPATF